MTVLTVELPDFTSPSGRADRIRFQDTAAGLIDATALRIIAGDAIITRLQINGDQGRCLMQIVETLGDPPGDVNPSLSAVWEQYNPAITLQATGLADLEISGPVAAGSDSTDTTEPYSWLPGSLITYAGGLDQWVSDFKAAYALDATLRATMVLDDGDARAAAASVAGGAGSISAGATRVPAAVSVARAAAASVAGGAAGISAGATRVPAAVTRAAAASIAGGAAGLSAGATRIAAPVPVVRGYVGRISQSPVAEALTDAGRLALDRAIPDPGDALAVAYDWERMPIDVLRSQAAAWGFAPFTTLLGETYERQIMTTFGQVCEYRNKWLVLDNFFAALEIIHSAEIVGLDGVRYAVDRLAGTWGGYDVTRARELWLLVTLPPAIPISNAEFIAYLAHAVRWLMPYYRHFVFLVFINQRIEARPAAHTSVGVAAMSYLEAVQA